MSEIEQTIDAYTEKNIYNLDNEVILNWYPKRIIDLIKAENKDEKEMTMLELGLGHGYTTNIFYKHFSRYRVLEGDERIIKKFREEHPENTAEIVHTYFENYNEDDKYDIILLGFILEHVDNPIEILKKYKKYLKKDGRMFVSVPNAESLHRRVGHAAGLLENLYKLSEQDLNLGHKRYYDVNKIKYECNKAGLSIKNIEGIFLKPITTQQMIKIGLSTEILDAFCEVGKNYPEMSLGILVECICD